MSDKEHEHEWYVGCRGCDIEPDVSEHYVTFAEHGWSVEHSLQCRMEGLMQQGCAYERAVRKMGRPSDESMLGRYRIVTIDHIGSPVLELAPIEVRT